MSDTPEAAARGMIGLSVWGAELGHGSFLTLEFGEPEPDDPARGAYHLWIYQCAWRIEHGTEVGAGCYDSESRIAASLNRINGRIITALEIERPSLSTTFIFDDARLITFETHTEGTDYNDRPEQWMLFRPDRQVLSVGPGSAWRLSPGNQP